MDARTRSRLVSLCVSGFQAPVHVIRVSVERELGANRDAILELASTTWVPVTLKVTATLSARMTRITSPVRNWARRVNTASPVHQLTWPLRIAFPGSPGLGPRSYQATLRKSAAVARSRLESRPRGSIVASTPIVGIISRAGVGSVPADGCAEGCAAKYGEGAAARNAGTGGVNNPIATNTPT